MNSNLNILLVEDELLIAEMLKDMLLEIGYMVAGQAKNFQIASDALHQNRNINFAILDINLNEAKSGFDVAEILRKFDIPFIFLTSYSDKKTFQEALVYEPKAFLIKPFTKTDLYTTLEIIKSKKNSTAKHIFIKEGQLNIKVHMDAILWIKSENVYLEIKTAEKTYLVRNSLDKYQEELNDDRFIRIHRSYLININHVIAINGLYVVIHHEKIPLSRKYRDEVMAIYQKKQ